MLYWDASPTNSGLSGKSNLHFLLASCVGEPPEKNAMIYTPSNIAPEKNCYPKWKWSPSNHPFSDAFAASLQRGYIFTEVSLGLKASLRFEIFINNRGNLVPVMSLRNFCPTHPKRTFTIKRIKKGPLQKEHIHHPTIDSHELFFAFRVLKNYSYHDCHDCDLT